MIVVIHLCTKLFLTSDSFIDAKLLQIKSRKDKEKKSNPKVS